MATALKRTLQVKTPAMRGRDVEALQRLLHGKRYLSGGFDGIYGTATAAAVYRAKLALGYAKPDHVAGELFWKYLTGAKTPTAAMRKAAAKRRAVVSKTPAGSTSSSPAKHKPTKAELAAAHEAQVRAKAVRAMRLLLANEPRVHYAQIRPMRTRSIDTFAKLEAAVRRGITFDCSESSTTIAHVAGAKDPNPGRHFDGVGYTGTMLQGPAITKSQLRPGDFVIFGPGTGHHVCVCLAAGSDPLLFSHGQEKGPIAIRLSVEARFQPPTIRYRRLVV